MNLIQLSVHLPVVRVHLMQSQCFMQQHVYAGIEGLAAGGGATIYSGTPDGASLCGPA